MILKTYNCPSHGDKDLWVESSQSAPLCSVKGCKQPLSWIPTGCNLGGDLSWIGNKRTGWDDIQLGYVRDRTHYRELTKNLETVTKPKFDNSYPEPSQLLKKKLEKTFQSVRRRA